MTALVRKISTTYRSLEHDSMPILGQAGRDIEEAQRAARFWRRISILLAIALLIGILF